MRPVRLELVGFGAFRDRTEVSFDDVDVVALVGPTGAGKSTIIDAVTFALFGAVARYGERDIAPVIHQLATEARVRLTFEVDGVTHDVVRVVRRTRTGATTREARLERGSTVLAGTARDVDAEVKRLLGIDAGQFNTTVVLPQGRFADFLQAEPRVRQALLRDLLGLGVYTRVGQAARQRAATAREQVRVAQEQLGELGDTSDGALATCVARVAQVEQARVAVASLAAELDAIEAARGVAARAADVAGASAASLRSVAAPAGLAELTERLHAAAEDVRTATEAQAAARERARVAARAAEHGPSPGRAEALLARRAELAELTSSVAEERRARSDAEQASRAAASAAAAVREEIVAARAAVGEARSRRDQLESSHAAEPGVAELVARLAQRAELAERRRVAEQAASSAETAREPLGALRSRVEEATAARERAELLAPAASLVAALVVGEPCPVCEHVVTAMPAGHHHDRRAVATAREAEKEAARRLRLADEAATDAAATARAARHATEQLAARLAGQPEAAELEELLVAARSREQELSAARAALAAAERRVADLEQSPAAAAAFDAEQRAGNQLAGVVARLQDLEGRLARLEADLREVPPEEALRTELAEAARLAKARSDAYAAEERADAEHAAAAARRGAVQAEEDGARAAFAAARDAVAALGPPPATGALAADWAALVAWAEERGATLVAEGGRHQAEVARLARAAGEVRSRCEEVSSGLVAAGWRTVGDLREGLGAAVAEARAAQAAVEAARARAADLDSRVVSLEQDAAVAEHLGELLSASAFERWLLDEAMADLVDRATVRLQALTGGQYSLVADGGGFKVRDHRNADELRDARSLSGGETFLASLALALALGEATAELAARGSARLESIFLDEGFGTLDPEALDVVASTIEELASGGRMVGLVTHIRELAERMPTRLEVRRAGGTSVVERVDR